MTKRLMTPPIPLVCFTISLVLAASPSAAQESNFAQLRLPLGVSVEVPQNWRVISGDANRTIQSLGEAALNLAGLQLPRGRVNLFRANSMPRTTYAGIAINAMDTDISAEELRSATNAEIRELTPLMRDELRRLLPHTNMELLEFSDVRRESVSGHPALVIEYKRSGPQGPVIVQMTRLVVGDKEISLNLSYRESEAVLWKPIVTYIRSTLKVK